MSRTLITQVKRAAELIKDGQVVAYPTEAVFGLGCDPNNTEAIRKILTLKGRSIDEGLILLAANWEQVSHYTKAIAPELMAKVRLSGPGAVTWLFPAADWVSRWIRGKHDTVAIRITSHPIAKNLCLDVGGPIISTSANVHQAEPARSIRMVQLYFDDQVAILSGALGGEAQPSRIIDVLSGEVLR